MKEHEELLEVVTEQGDIITIVPRSEIHGNPSLIHKVVHVLVFDSKGALLLQKRSMHKDVAPGKWDTSVGGHVNAGEGLYEAVQREMKEELGITTCMLAFLYRYLHVNPYETELVFTYECNYDGEIHFNRREIDEIRRWSVQEIEENIGNGVFSDNFEHEFRTYMENARSK